MKAFSKIPLYLGLSVLVISILFSVAKLGNKNSIADLKSKAATDGASLSLSFSSPDIVSVALTSDKEVAGVDAVITFNKDAITILPSTLAAGKSFVTSGGEVNEESSTFSFSALAQAAVTSGIVATFHVQAKGTESVAANLQFAGGAEKTAVIEKATGGNILSQSTGTTFTVLGRKGE